LASWHFLSNYSHDSICPVNNLFTTLRHWLRLHRKPSTDFKELPIGAHLPWFYNESLGVCFFAARSPDGSGAEFAPRG
ncbi:MAG: hypothetical protein NTZ46_00085, partial [Verrucomicrobia bacterium]|nr:hypothetical protein [Verrucomicrobiota bacterium]